jgi:ribonuclease P/MRP protein subunit POP3
LDIASAVPMVIAPWLVPATANQIEARNLEQTHIKQLRTTAPKDIRAAKKQRALEKAAIRSAKQPEVTPTLTKKRKRSSATGREIKKKIRIT